MEKYFIRTQYQGCQGHRPVFCDGCLVPLSSVVTKFTGTLDTVVLVFVCFVLFFKKEVGPSLLGRQTQTSIYRRSEAPVSLSRW